MTFDEFIVNRELANEISRIINLQDLCLKIRENMHQHFLKIVTGLMAETAPGNKHTLCYKKLYELRVYYY